MKVVAFVLRVLKALVAAVVAGAASYQQGQDLTVAVGAAVAAGLAVFFTPNIG